MRSLSLSGTLAHRWKGWGRPENRRTVPGVPTPRRWYLLPVLTLLGLILLAPTGWSLVAHYIQHHPYFAISTIEVNLEPGAIFSPEEIIAWSGITPGMNLWTIDPENVRARLLAYQGLRSVDVRREFPHRVVVQVQTRHPIALVVRPSPTYLDKDGVWFSTQTPKGTLDLPYATGFNLEELDATTAGTVLPGLASRVLLATELLTESLSEIRWDQKLGYTLFLSRRHLSIRLGWEMEPEKFAQLAKVLAHWPIDAPPALIDARFVNQVVVRPLLDEYALRPVTPADPL